MLLLFRETNASISCIPMRTIDFSWPLVKRNQILSMDEVLHVLRTNFESKQNECYKCFFCEINASISCIPMRITHLSWPFMKKKNQILTTYEVCPILRMNFDSKQNKGYKYFFRKTNTSISCIKMRPTHLCGPLMKRNQILYTDEVCPVLKDKLRFQTKRKPQMLLLQNQCINIVYPNENYPFVLASPKKKLDLSMDEVCPILRTNFVSRQN